MTQTPDLRCRCSYRCATPALLVLMLLVPAITGCGTPFSATERVTLTAPYPVDSSSLDTSSARPRAAGRLVVRSSFGEIKLHADDAATEIRAEVEKTGRGTTPAEAKRALEEIQVELVRNESGVVRGRARHTRNSLLRKHEVSWDVTAPPEVAVDARSDFGDVEASGFTRGVRLSSDFGDIEAEAAGVIHLSTDFGEITAHILQGTPDDVTVSTDFGDVRLEVPSNRAGRLVGDTDFGSVRADLQGMIVKLVRSRGHHMLAELGTATEPRIDVSTDFGDVVIRSYPVPEVAQSPDPTTPQEP